MVMVTWVVCWCTATGERCLCDFETRDDALAFAMVLCESGRCDITVPSSFETTIDEAHYEAIKTRIFERIRARVAGLPAAYALLEAAL